MEFSKQFKCFGTDIGINIIAYPEASTSAKKSIQDTEKFFFNIENNFSRFNPQSEISRLNNSLHENFKISPEMLEILTACLKYYHASAGYFDPRIINDLEKIGYLHDFHSHNFNLEKENKVLSQSYETALENVLILSKTDASVILHARLDIAGLVKGFAVDQAAKMLLDQNWNNFIIDAGGDMFAFGTGTSTMGWLIDIENISANDITFKIQNEAIATSGRTRRHWQIDQTNVHHLINPKKPDVFSFELQTVTVIDDRTMSADAWAKILFLMGLKNGLEYANEKKIKALFLDNNGKWHESEKIKENIIHQ